MKKYLSLIEKNTLLSFLNSNDIDAYLKDGSFAIKKYGKNGIVHLSGEQCEKLEIILSGKVAVDCIDDSGNLMSIAEFYGNEILGGNLLFSQSPCYPMTITAKNPTVILEISKELLFTLFAGNQAFLKGYLEYVSDHAVILGEQVKRYANKTIRKCIIDYLEHESLLQNSRLIRLSITKTALAEKIGVRRTSLSRELAKMKKDGLIEYDNKYIKLL